jgi:3-deoxy-D-manno-octulosonic-acid transferase
MENFPSVMPVFIQANAIVQVGDVQSLEAAVAGLLADESARAALGERAARVVADNRGVIQKTLRLLDAISVGR